MSLVHLERLSDGTADSLIAYEVPDDFDAVALYETFSAGFRAAHPTKSNRLTSRQLKTRDHQWVVHLDRLFKRVALTSRA